MNNEMDFAKLRNDWALKSVVPKDRLDMERQADYNANPHNDSYANKRPRRSDSEIISDVSFSNADAVLARQYGKTYTYWLASVARQDHFTQVWHWK